MSAAESSAPGSTCRPEPRSGAILLLTYALGPFAPAVLLQGRHNVAWTLLSLLALLSWGGMVWRWDEVREAVGSGAVALVPWLLGVALVTVVWVIAGARALWLAGSDPRFATQRLPRWLRKPRLCMGIGFVLPGFGHLVSGHPRRAAVVAVITTSTGLPWLILWQANWIWQCNRDAGSAAVPGLALEVVFLTAAALAVCGTLAWVAGSLDGARLQAERLGHHVGLHGDRVALALLLTWILTLFNLQPAHLAGDLDRLAVPMQQQGYRLVPLCLEWTAMRLDRAEPRYPMVSADLLDALGKHASAESLRRDLRRHWESYAEHLLREEVRIDGLLYPPLISVTGDEELLPPWSAAGANRITSPGDSMQAAPMAGDSTTVPAAGRGDNATSVPSVDAPGTGDSLRPRKELPDMPPAGRDSL